MASSGATAAAPTEKSSNVRRRWLVLVGSLLIGMAAAFGLGSAVKSTSATTAATSSSLQPTVSLSGGGATVLALNGSAAIPALKAPPKPPKPKTTQSSTAASQATLVTPTTSVQPTTPAQPTHTFVPTPQPTHSSPPPPQTTTGIASGGG